MHCDTVTAHLITQMAAEWQMEGGEGMDMLDKGMSHVLEGTEWGRFMLYYIT